jgi:hypothetical protein
MMSDKTCLPVNEMNIQDLVDFAKEVNGTLSDFHVRILNDNVFAKRVYEKEILGLVYAEEVIDELVRRLGCYIADQEIWLSYDQANQVKPEKMEEK